MADQPGLEPASCATQFCASMGGESVTFPGFTGILLQEGGRGGGFSFFFLAQTKMSWRSPLTSQYSR